MNRRLFFTALIRYLLLTIIALVSGAALLRDRERSNTSCPPGMACKSCSKARSCNADKNKLNHTDDHDPSKNAAKDKPMHALP